MIKFFSRLGLPLAALAGVAAAQSLTGAGASFPYPNVSDVEASVTIL